MTGTRVFLSSNCYDLLDLRAVLEDFLRNEGYDPLLSNRLDFPVVRRVAQTSSRSGSVPG